MSLLNAFMNADESSALIAVDTEGTDPEGRPAAHLSKLAPIVHWPAVIAIRGAYAYLPIFFVCLSTHPVGDLCDLIEYAEARLKDMHEAAKSWREQGLFGADVQIDQYELALVWLVQAGAEDDRPRVALFKWRAGLPGRDG